MERYNITITVAGYIKADGPQEANKVADEIADEIRGSVDIFFPYVEVDDVDYVNTIENTEQLTAN